MTRSIRRNRAAAPMSGKVARIASGYRRSGGYRPTGAAGRVARAGAFAAALGTALLAAGCGAGQLAQTAEVVPAVPGANSTESNSILLRNVMVTYPGDSGYRQGATAPLEAWIFNTGQRPVTLVRVTTSAASSVTMTGGTVTTASPSVSPLPPSAGATPSLGSATSPSAGSTAGGTPSGEASQSPPASESAQSSQPGESASPSASAGAPAGGQIRVSVPPAGYAVLTPSAGAALQLVGLTRALLPGESVPGVRFEFDNGTVLTLDVPVDLPDSSGPRSPMVFPESSAGTE